MNKRCSVFRVHHSAQNPNLRRKLRGRPEETKAGSCGSDCDAKQTDRGREYAGRLSTEAEPRAWQQAAREADKRAHGEPLSRGNVDEGKGRDRQLSSRSLKLTRTKESGSKGKCRSESEGKHLGNSCGSEPG